MFNQIERNLAYIIPLLRSTGKKNCTNLARTDSKSTAKKLLQFLEDIQPDKEELEYLLMYLSTALYGNSLQLFTVLTGIGRNGKSKFVELLKEVFGKNS